MSQGLLAGPAPPPMTCRHISAAGGHGSNESALLISAAATPWPPLCCPTLISSSSLQRDAALTSETPWPGPIVAGEGGGGGGGVLPPDHHRPAMLIPGDFGTKSIKALQGMLEGLSDSVYAVKQADDTHKPAWLHACIVPRAS
ncbi:hypothetical protein GQ55_6G244900 [Panicum hallii var. hallii]|uniref:Uncharacterized protein n=1 Tax=Panicum hallii var. hallii TaxID=1504633 RepID=A0A2T7D951_9POAL|nr:hypothetical protein GQ55_6G244900 [Panicum hallii var. hallii]